MTPLQLGKYSNYKKQYSKDIIFMESKNAKINNAKMIQNFIKFKSKLKIKTLTLTQTKYFNFS